MRNSFFLTLIILLQLSVFAHVIFIASYVKSKSTASFRGFFATTFTNFTITAIMVIMLMQTPQIIYKFKLEFVLLVEAGLVFILLLLVKVRISLRIILRSRDPEYYDINFFGKKVYKTKIISKGEVAAFILTMPVTLFAGAYFFVKLLMD
jgi:hypothetical protein